MAPTRIPVEKTVKATLLAEPLHFLASGKQAKNRFLKASPPPQSPENPLGLGRYVRAPSDVRPRQSEAHWRAHRAAHQRLRQARPRWIRRHLHRQRHGRAGKSARNRPGLNWDSSYVPKLSFLTLSIVFMRIQRLA